MIRTSIKIFECVMNDQNIHSLNSISKETSHYREGISKTVYVNVIGIGKQMQTQSCLLIWKWLKKLWSICTVECYAAIG